MAPVASAELQDFVAHGCDYGHEEDARCHEHHGRQLADDGESQDRDEQDHYQELGAAAGMRGWVLARRLYGERIAALESMDRHVFGTVVLERATHVGSAAHQQQVADEDHDPNCTLGELQPKALVHAPDGGLGQQQRQQEEDADAQQEAEQEHAPDGHRVALAEAVARGLGGVGGGFCVGVGVAGV